ncbi:winged helix-turn-helix domain-containing protein [Streptomyces sp. WM6386]|uniref:winged helix-turn-helix domain-containing protein n=1 Tax=Streptomyces sp. WM6386 TaxID=1415558 RepID=UPI000619048B|nr:helix-turn-helix domain-containing protein [Streptomyces sp. WM6386]KKD07691.1 ArsR family transcriptional regulator [Streptomyces sp. WM6386]
MLRIHFTPHDLQNIRILRKPDPLWELICSMCRLDTGQGPLEFGHWRRSVRARVEVDRVLGAALQPLRTLVPNIGYIPDFLTPPTTGGELSYALDLVRGTSRTRLVRELTRLGDSQVLPSWTVALGRPGDKGLAMLIRALDVYFGAALQPHWSRIRAVVGNDIDLRTRTLLDGGTQALLNDLYPLARWKPPVLEVDYPVRRDLRLEGRGLLLVPSFFCWRRATALADPALPPVLVYPVAKTPLDVARATGDGVGRLLGRTRAAILADVARRDGRTSSEVAEAVGIAPASVSYQMDVLRAGGLVESHRAGKYVLHSATALGLRLLDVR